MPDRQVRLLFPAVGEMRLYAAAGAPLRRVEFEVGSEVEDHEGQRLRVEEVRDDEGVLTYVGGGLEIPEALLSDRLQFGGAMDRLLAGDFDLLQEYDLRRRVFDFNHKLESVRSSWIHRRSDRLNSTPTPCGSRGQCATRSAGNAV